MKYAFVVLAILDNSEGHHGFMVTMKRAVKYAISGAGAATLIIALVGFKS